MIGPDTTLIDCRVGPDATVLSSHAHGAVIGPGASVGPYTHLRPGSELAADARVGAYVEMKSRPHRAGRQGAPPLLRR